MRRKSIVTKAMAVLSVLFLLSASSVMAQIEDPCYGDFDCDGDVMQSDIARFKASMGRWLGVNPCPTCQYNPCNCYVEVPKTGQTTCYDSSGTVISCTGTGQDGEYQKGVEWPNPRFTDNGDGTVTDNLTGLIWLKDANCINTNYSGFDNDGTVGDGMVTWQHALDFVSGINDGTYPDCGAGNTDWRLPNSNELASLIHKGYYGPALPNTAGTGQWSADDPFDNVQFSLNASYWSSATSEEDHSLGWYVRMSSGGELYSFKSLKRYVWPVRGGND